MLVVKTTSSGPAFLKSSRMSSVEGGSGNSSSGFEDFFRPNMTSSSWLQKNMASKYSWIWILEFMLCNQKDSFHLATSIFQSALVFYKLMTMAGVGTQQKSSKDDILWQARRKLLVRKIYLPRKQNWSSKGLKNWKRHEWNSRNSWLTFGQTLIRIEILYDDQTETNDEMKFVQKNKMWNFVIFLFFRLEKLGKLELMIFYLFEKNE